MKTDLNSLPLSNSMHWGRGYCKSHLSENASMTSVAVGFLIGIISNQYVKIAGSITATVKHLTDLDPVCVCVLTAHGPIKSTSNLFQGST
jgi:hypothetical protein